MKDGVDVVKDNMKVKMICECGNMKTSFKKTFCDKCIEKRRIWDDVKMRYHYIYCKCGSVKESYRSAYCVKCQRDKYNRINNRNLTDYDLEVITKDDAKLRLIKFINKVEDDGGYISFNDLFIEMITLYNCYFSDGMDSMKPAKQLTTMWRRLNELYYKIV